MSADNDWLGADYQPHLHTQQYAPRAAIEGVRFLDLCVFHDEGGDFCELARLSGVQLDALPDYQPVQISYSRMEPGTIKAWHLHREQDDLWFVPPLDRVLVGLLDTRPNSATYRQSMRFALGTGEGRLLFIPRGVAHGVANLGTAPASIIYFVNRAFNAERPDEHRLPWDHLGAEFWTIQPG
ncbi:MAG: dTDP-4-dehydrorhamnose 3,5-epimerase family protein [Chloroflexota bacterium]